MRDKRSVSHLEETIASLVQLVCFALSAHTHDHGRCIFGGSKEENEFLDWVRFERTVVH